MGEATGAMSIEEREVEGEAIGVVEEGEAVKTLTISAQVGSPGKVLQIWVKQISRLLLLEAKDKA